MPISVPNPYTGKDDQTCSVSVGMQQDLLGGPDVSNQQTEAQYNTSKQLGEWGVISAKLAKGEIPTGTKLLTFTNNSGGRGYFYAKGGGLHKKAYSPGGTTSDIPVSSNTAEAFIKSEHLATAIPQAVAPNADPIAAPTPSPAVTPGSDSVGSMSHEDVAAMFVKIKDDLAKEQGLNIKGANPGLDEVVYKAIGDKTGYSAAEVKAKIDAYKADGNKLSALKKKVMNGSKKVPEGKPQPTKQAAPSSPLAAPTVKAKAPDPAPNGVPTVATPKLADAVKADVKATVAAAPAKHYSDEDVASAYIIAKDSIVAGSNGKWTLYSKNDELDALIAKEVADKTGMSTLQQKQAIANYLGSGKKLSTLKKQLAKQGAFDPKADTLKSSKTSAPKPQTAQDKFAELLAKKKEAEAKADAGYTPTPTPSSAGKAGDPQVDTGKPAPKAVVREAAESGDISRIPEADAQHAFQAYKSTGHYSYLSSGPSANYEGLVQAQAKLAGEGKQYTLLQLIRMVDAQGAKKFSAENTKLLEKQTATWLTTPDGTAYVKATEVKVAKLAEQAKLKIEAEKAAKLLEANQPPLPADSAQFKEMTPQSSYALGQQMLAAKPFGPGEKDALRHYTGGAYHAMNGHLRGLSKADGKDLTSIDKAVKGFRPTPEPILLRRGTGANQFMTLGAGRGDTHLLWGFTGKTFQDNGFLSTSGAGRAAFGGEVAMEIEAPVGTPMMWVDDFSKHKGENEMLLAPGLKYKILNVRKEGGTFVVRVRIVDWPGKD